MEEFKDEDLPSNTLELFVEKDEIIEMIKQLKSTHNDGFEKSYEKYSEILGRYQEQPHLLDPHINKLIEELLIYIRDKNSPPTLFHGAFKYFYQLSNVRTYKVLVKFLPHELSDLEFVLNVLEEQSINDSENWETRYMLLLWMSIVVLNPFHMSRLDAFNTENEMRDINHIGEMTKMERIYILCQRNSKINDTCSMVAAFLCAKFLIRIDVKEIYLPKFIEWVSTNHRSDLETAKFGQLAAIALTLKHGKRDDLLQFCGQILKWIIECDYKNSSDFLKYKYYIKIVQRVGLIYLKPRLAHWRYQRGSRSLAANLSSNLPVYPHNVDSEIDNSMGQEDDEDIFVPDEIEDIVEELLQALRSPSSDIRWLAAKGIGRITNRLPKFLGDEVVGSVIEIFNPLEPHEAWHGACLAIAELAKRGLLLPYRLSTMVPHLLEALVYDEMKGYMSVGQHIRDSACYMSWAFARAYNPSDLQPFVEKIAAGLLVTTVFDREINCRRAASAAFQESVGRLGNFPHGIDILTAADFYSVGLRSNSYLHISDFIAQYEQYRIPLIDHLVNKKVNHWDTVIRELTAKALNVLTKRTPEYISSDILPILFEKTNSIDINTRHGSVLAIGEIILALSSLEKEDNSITYIKNETIKQADQLISTFIKRDQFRGISGEMMKQCCCDYIKNCSLAKIPVSEESIESWQFIIDRCITNKSAQIRDISISALNVLCESHYNNTKREQKNIELIETYLYGCNNDLEEHIRMGYVAAVGVLPKFLLELRLNDILTMLIKRSLVPSSMQLAASKENVVTLNWSEARKESIKAMSIFIKTVGFNDTDNISLAHSDYLARIFQCLLNALEEYTKDNRGDIGAWVREASMNALYLVLTICPHKLLKADIVHSVMLGLVQQAVEKIDRTRGLAGKLFCKIINHTPSIPYIQRHEELKAIFPQDFSKVLWLFADHTFPMFCAMLELPEYSKSVILGLSASVGQLTESLIKYSSASMFQYLKSHPNDIPRIGNETLMVFQNHINNDRVTHPMLNFMDLVLSSGAFNNLLSDENSNFPDELYRLVTLEMKGNKKLYKLVSSINVLCQLIQVSKLCPKILSKMAIFLGQPHVHIRKSTASKLYEALTLYGDTSGIPEENLDDILMMLSETDWGNSLNEIRPIRNNLCTLMGVIPPVSRT